MSDIQEMDRLSEKLAQIIDEQDFCFEPDEMKIVLKAISRFKAYENSGLTPQEFHESADFVLELNKKLKPYVDAVQQKRCVLFPCAIGETIYFIDGSWANGKLMYRSNRGFEIVEVQFDPRTMWNFEKNTFVSHYFLTEKEAQEFIELNTDGAVKFFGSQARLRKNKL